MTQVELARVLGIDQSNVSSIERGIRSLTVHQALKLARALDTSTDEILGRKDTAPEGPRDRRFLRRLEKIERLPKRDQQALLRTIDAFLKSAKNAS